MARDIFLNEDRRGEGTKYVAMLVGLAVTLGGGGYVAFNQFRIDVPSEHIAILINKTGLDIANADEVAPSEEYKGVQRDVLREGVSWRNPLYWDWEIVRQTQIEQGQLGITISLTGDDLPYGEFLAKLDADGNPLTKGIMPDVLRAGRYPINPYLYSVQPHDPVTVPAGYKGVVTNLAGPFPQNPNSLLVEDGERGVQEATFEPGTYYVNPYVTRVNLVDCRSQRFNLARNKDMGFPSKDGFWVSLDGVIEFRVKPEKAAEVFVVYNEKDNGEKIDLEIISKVILPNARSFCRLEGSKNRGREFIQGDTRTQFQENFQKAMRAAGEPLGIEIIQALITNIKPPQQIASPVREREIAKQQEKQYQQQILQQKSEQQLAIEKELVKQRQAIVKADQEVVKITTEAKREQQVAVTKANERKGVAGFKLQAATDEAEAIVARGKAEAEVIHFENEADAAGWKRAVEAFSGNGNEYAQYVMYQKLASAYRSMMVNTADSPIMRIFESFAAPLDNEPAAPPVAGSLERASSTSATDRSRTQDVDPAITAESSDQ